MIDAYPYRGSLPVAQNMECEMCIMGNSNTKSNPPKWKVSTGSNTKVNLNLQKLELKNRKSWRLRPTKALIERESRHSLEKSSKEQAVARVAEGAETTKVDWITRARQLGIFKPGDVHGQNTGIFALQNIPSQTVKFFAQA